MVEGGVSAAEHNKAIDLILSYTPNLNLEPSLIRAASKAQNTRLIQRLLDEGCDLNNSVHDPDDPLRNEINGNNPEIIKLVLEKGLRRPSIGVQRELLEFAI